MEKIENITESKIVQQIRDRASHIFADTDAIVLHCTEWSDDFDPSVSTKANRQSCWIKTVTIMSCNDGDDIMAEMMSRTFPIAAGKKGKSQQAVESRFAYER